MQEGHHPISGIDYPETYPEFLNWFDSEESCRLYLQKCRWPDGFVCNRCGSTKEPWTTSRGYLHCRECQHEVSVTAGTVFHRTRLPLRTWFSVAWFVTSQKDGASALGLQNALGIRSYQTAWTWLHKLRSAMVRPDRDLLSGVDCKLKCPVWKSSAPCQNEPFFNSPQTRIGASAWSKTKVAPRHARASI